MPGESERTAHAWEEIVKQLTQEQDHFRVAHKLNEAMLADEREKVRRRLGVERLNAGNFQARPNPRR